MGTGITIFLSLIPSAIIGLGVWLIQRSINKHDMERVKREESREKQEEARNEARKKNEVLLIKLVGASISLGEATAVSVQRMDPLCNGDMKKALEYAQNVKHEQKDFLNEQGVEHFL